MCAISKCSGETVQLALNCFVLIGDKYHILIICSFVLSCIVFNILLKSSRKHLRAKVTPDFQLTYSKKWGKSGVGIKMIKMDNFQYFSINSYVMDVY